jgi:hypothetical protein
MALTNCAGKEIAMTKGGADLNMGEISKHN